MKASDLDRVVGGRDGSEIADQKRLMSMDASSGRRMATVLAHRIGADADARQVADAVVATWQEIEVALSPIIGSGGVVGLSTRSLHLTGAKYSWLEQMQQGARTAIDPQALRAVLAQQSRIEAVHGGSAFLQTFYDLLTSLVGPALSRQLLGSLWADPLGSASEKEKSS